MANLSWTSAAVAPVVVVRTLKAGVFGGGTNAPVWGGMTFCTNGVVGVSYTQTFDLQPAASPTTYTLLTGTLPPGLALSNVSADIGRLSGTPTAAGTYSFTLRATNSYGTADKAFTVTIAPPVSGGGGNYGYTI